MPPGRVRACSNISLFEVAVKVGNHGVYVVTDSNDINPEICWYTSREVQAVANVVVVVNTSARSPL